MKLHALELRHYRRHADTRIEFPEGATAVLGRNGSGKSTLLEAIGFALFGTAATRGGKEQLRSQDAPPGDGVHVRLTFEVAGQAVEVVRELKGKNLTPSASLQVDGVAVVPPGAGSAKTVTEQVERLLGVTADGFFTTVVARQKELARLGDLGPTDRKRLILGMLGVDRLDRAIAHARGQRRDLDARLKGLQEVLGDLKALQEEHQQAKEALAAARRSAAEAKTAAAVAGKASETATAHLAEARRAAETYQQTEQALQVARAEADHATRQLKAEEERAHEAATAAKEAASLEPAAAKRTEAERHLQEARAAHEAHRRHQEAEARLVKQQQEAEALAKTVPPAPVGLAEAQVAADQARQRQAKADEAVALARQEAGRLEAQLTRLRSLGRDGPCPTCTRPLHDHLDDLLANAGAEHAAAVTAAEARGREAAQAAEARQKADAALQALQAEQQKHDAAKARSAAATAALEAARDLVGPAPPLPPDLSPLETELTTAQKAHDAWQRALSRAQGARPEALASARSRVESALAKQRRAQSDLDRRPDPAPALRQAEGDEAEARRRHREAERLGAEATTALGRAEERADSARLRLEEEQARRRKARELRGELRYWTALVDPRRQGLLERFRDHLVARVGPAVSAEASHLLARFTQGRYTEVVLDADYRLLVADGGILHPVERFSGGETDLVHLALRLGVSRLLAGRSGQAELRFLALDEVFGSLDAERRRAVVGALDGLKGLYAQILVITHLEDLRDGLDHVLEVQGEASGDAVVRLD